MKAAVLQEFNKPLVVREVKDPVPKGNEVLVKVRASGLCATDLHQLQGEIPSITLPRIIGHELAGEVVQLGEHVEGLRVGDKVISPVDIACLRCRFCRTGRERLCLNRQRLSFERDGSHAELCLLPASNLCLIPDMPFEKAAALTDSFVCTYAGLKHRAGVCALDKVLIYGVGGLGLAAVQLAKSMGAVVYAADIRDESLEVAKELGAKAVFNTRNCNLFDEIKKETAGEMLDVAVDLVGLNDSVQHCVSVLRPGGSVLLIGYTDAAFTCSFPPVIQHGRSILGHRGADRTDLLDVIELYKMGKIDPYIGHTITLDEINQGLADLKAGKYPGRIVVTF